VPLLCLCQVRVTECQQRVTAALDKMRALQEERVSAGESTAHVRRLSDARKGLLTALLRLERQEDLLAAITSQSTAGTSSAAAAAAPSSSAAPSQGQEGLARYDLDVIVRSGHAALPWSAVRDGTQLWLLWKLATEEMDRCKEQRIIQKAQAANCVALYMRHVHVLALRVATATAEVDACVGELLAAHDGAGSPAIAWQSAGQNLASAKGRAWLMARRLLLTQQALEAARVLFNNAGMC
jgi:hypothetical protein